jgi:hypothetical protein
VATYSSSKKVVLLYSYGPHNNDKVKELANEFFHENHQLNKVVEMKGTVGSFVPVRFSRTGIERLKNWSGKCEGSGEGIDGLKNRSEKCEGSGEGIDGLKNRSEKCEGSGGGIDWLKNRSEK